MGKEDIAPPQFYSCVNSHCLQVNTYFKKSGYNGLHLRVPQKLKYKIF